MHTMGQEEAAQLPETDGPRAEAIDVDQLASQVRQLAGRHDLRIVPATPLSTAGSCQLVLLGSDDLSAADFCELAATAGARLLYVQAEYFDAGTDPDLDRWRAQDRPGATGDLLAPLHRDAQLFSGRIRQLELAFAVGCVLHCWTVAADWYSGLVDGAARLGRDLDPES
jgi:hypothetical protein